MKIKIDSKKCSGCRLCEMVCSLFHLGLINTERSAIRIHENDSTAKPNFPSLCRQCKEMKCLEGEDVDKRLEKRRFAWPRSRAERCPFRSLPVFCEEAYHCDLCGGNPRCIRVCTTRAIHL